MFKFYDIFYDVLSDGGGGPVIEDNAEGGDDDTADDGSVLSPAQSLARMLAKSKPVEAQKESDDTFDNESGDVEDQEDSDDDKSIDVIDFSSEKSFMFKDGENNYSLDDIRDALKDRKDKENWVGRLTQESQVMNWMKKSLSPEQQQRFIDHSLPIVYGKSQLPEDFKPSEIFVDVELLHTDEDTGESVPVKGKKTIAPGSEEYQNLYKQFEQQFLKEYNSVFKELKTWQDHAEEFQEMQRSAANSEIVSFIKDYGFKISTEGSIEESLKSIVMAGESHPSYRDADKLIALSQIAQQRGQTLAQAYKSIYGEPSIQKKKASDQEKQKKKRLLKPSGSSTAESSENFFGDRVEKQISDIFSGKIK